MQCMHRVVLVIIFAKTLHTGFWTTAAKGLQNPGLERLLHSR